MSKTKIVEMKDFKFAPDKVVIEVGDKVKWINRDDTPHNATRDNTPTFDTGLLGENEESKEIEFTSASDSNGIKYFCTPHRSFMKATVIVTLLGSRPASFSRDSTLKTHKK